MKLLLQALQVIAGKIAIFLAALAVAVLACSALTEIAEQFPIASLCVGVAIIVVAWLIVEMISLDIKAMDDEEEYE